MSHQNEAANKLIPLKVGGLFMEMGTGKSLTAIMIACARRHKISKFVWCCPVSLKINTMEQIITHTNRDDNIYLFDDKTT
ncbi:hypothetical protein KKJ00_19120, partial [Xenorhabdus bovienii]|nr:hypothetical protein [Xenorhabdus bovienii]